MLTSTHKIVGSLTQSAMLHVAATGPRSTSRAVGARHAARALDVAVSSLLMASLDAARRQLAVHGEALLHETIAAAAPHAREDGDDPGIALVDERLRRAPGRRRVGPAAARRSTCAGRAARATRSPRRCATPTTSSPSSRPTRRWCSLLGIAQSPLSLERVAGDLDEIVKRIAREGTARRARAPDRRRSRTRWSSRRATRSSARPRSCAVDDAVGRISCESIAGYPPGIPALLPGERITAEAVAYLRELRDAGARLHGASDPSFATITVLR